MATSMVKAEISTIQSISLFFKLHCFVIRKLCHQKRGERVRERAMQKHRDNQTWWAYRPKPDLSSLIFWPAPHSTLTIYRIHQHTTPNSSTKKKWFAQNKNQHVGSQGADPCALNQINKPRIVSCPIYNAHPLSCNRNFWWCLRA